jgi:hypothetical protein
MTLTTHSVAGALIAQTFVSIPVIGLPLAFFSHFVLDAIPHREYKTVAIFDSNGISTDKKLFSRPGIWSDLFKIGLDFGLGLVMIVLLVWIWGVSLNGLVVTGGLLGMFPDFMQFVYSRLPIKPLKILQSFHMWIHTDSHLEKDDQFILGLASQSGVIAVCILIGVYLF